MTQFAETRRLEHPADFLFDIVADVARYPDFVPWCVGARLGRAVALAPGIDRLEAELLVGFKAFRERYTSDVTRDRPGLSVTARHIKGPFHHLDSQWHFKPLGERATAVTFNLDFAFKNPILSFAADKAFGLAAGRMMAAFEARADQLANLAGST